MFEPHSVLQAITETFINREHETAIVKEYVNAIRYGSTVHQVIFNFFGVAGIGKSMLSREIYKRMQALDIPCALIDFQNSKYRDCGALLENIAASMSSEVDWQAWLLQESQVTEAFLDYADYLLRYSERAPMVLLFDTTEAVERELFDWLEQEIFIPLLRKKKVVIVITGRGPWQPREFYVSRRIRRYRLQPFDTALTDEQLCDYRHLTHQIIKVTFGHPYANRRLVEKIYELEQTNGAFDPKQFDMHKAMLTREVVRGVIDNKVLSDVPVDIQRALHIIAPLRQFDVNALRDLLTRFLPQEFGVKSGHYFLTIIRRMIETTLVEWNSERRAYVLDPTIRWMLALDMQLCRQDDFMAVHKRAINLYDTWIQSVPQARNRCLVEKLYHIARLAGAEGEPAAAIGKLLQEELAQCLRQHYGAGDKMVAMADLERLLDVLKDDTELDQASGGCLDILIDSIKELQHRHP